MAHTQKNRTFGNIARHLENNGGPILALVALLAFIVYLVYAHFYPNAVVVKTLQAHGSSAQVVSVAVVLFVAFTMWGGQKVLFKIAERERLKDRNARLEESLESQAARVQILERLHAEQKAHIAEQKAHIAEQKAHIAEQEARIVELENEKRQQNEAERQ